MKKNRILDSGGENGIGIDVQGKTESVTITGNEVRETRKPMKRIGIRIGAETRDIKLVDNRITGVSKRVDRAK